PFDDAELRALTELHDKSLSLNHAEWASPEMLAFKRDGDQLEQPLDSSNPERRADHVIHQYQPPTWPQHALHLRYRVALVRDGAQRKRAQDRVECGIRQVQRLGVAETQVHLAAKRCSALARDLQHGWTELDPGQANIGAVEQLG